MKVTCFTRLAGHLALLLVVLTVAVSPANAQLFGGGGFGRGGFGGGGFGGNGFSGGGFRIGQGSRPSNPFDRGGRTSPHREFYPGEGGGLSKTEKVLGIVKEAVGIGGALINTLPPPPPPQIGRPPVVVYPQPIYPHYPSQPQPQPVVKKNVVAAQLKPRNNQVPIDAQTAAEISAATDAEQINEADAMDAQANAAIEQALDKMATNVDPNNPDDVAAFLEMEKAWNDYLANPTNENLANVQGFTEQMLNWGGADAVTLLDVKAELGQYTQDLLDGKLTGKGKDQVLDGLQGQIDQLADPNLQADLQGRLDKLSDLNELGKLADLAQGQNNPLIAILNGADQLGLGPDLVGDLGDLPIVDCIPVTDASSARSIDGTYLYNSKDNPSGVNYAIDHHEYTMAPGESQSFSAGRLITFDNGHGKEKSYRLSEGSYQFVLTNAGWDVQKQKSFEVTIDNSEYSEPFYYVVDNQQDMAPAGSTVTLSSPYPIEIVFDQGDGGKPARKRLTSGTFVVAIDAQTGWLDLFDAEQMATTRTDAPTLANQRRASSTAHAQLVREKLGSKGGSDRLARRASRR